MVAQQCCLLVRDPVMLSDCLLIRNPNNTLLKEFAFVMSCHCVSRFLAAGGACLRILWLGNRVLHDSQHSQFGNFILIAFFSDYHVGNAGPLIAYAVGWVLCIHFMCCRLISSVIEISMTLSLSGLVFFIQVLLSSDCPLGCVGLWTGYEARSGSSYPLPLLIVWDPELARQSGGILHIGMWVVSTTFLLTRAFYFSLFLVVSGEAFFMIIIILFRSILRTCAFLSPFGSIIPFISYIFSFLLFIIGQVIYPRSCRSVHFCPEGSLISATMIFTIIQAVLLDISLIMIFSCELQGNLFPALGLWCGGSSNSLFIFVHVTFCCFVFGCFSQYFFTFYVRIQSVILYFWLRLLQWSIYWWGGGYS